ncbi:MAG: ABC transporter ATP-binding protein [Deltaproteobacteria bacterium]|nr:ABC transporter ATP-binding protein [Deltaproteobacteria bacterium]
MIDVSNVRKTYELREQSVLALNRVTFHVESGSFVSIVGPSGCGKSTLLLAVAGIIPIDGGAISIEGAPVCGKNAGERLLGMVFQRPVLLPWRSVLENVLFPIEILVENKTLGGNLRSYRERAAELVEMMGLAEFRNAYPRELSGGMQQRVSICRSLVYDPPVILMDEPFGALDAFTRQRLNRELLEIWERSAKTILFVTHSLEEAVYLSDTVVVMSPRPGTVRDILRIDLKRPRSLDVRNSSRYHELVGKAYSYFQDIL